MIRPENVALSSYVPCMAMQVRRLRAQDGTEQVLLDLADFLALVDAAAAATYGQPDLHAIVERVRANFEANEPGIDLDDFLAAYDAAHPAD